MTPPDCDVAIVGGGLVGASLALALVPTGLRCVMLEAAPVALPPPAWDERCIGLNEASVRIFAALGAWDAIRPDASPILATHISERGRFGVARFTAQEARLPALGYNTPMRAIHGAVLAALRDRARLIAPARVVALRAQPDWVDLEFTRGDAAQPEALRARLVVACDGAQSAVRGLLDIGAQVRDYGQTAIVSAVRPERPHQGVAYERFTPEGPIAVLPRPDDRCTIIWTVPTESAAEILAWDDARFLGVFHAAFGHRLGRFLECGRRSGYPLSRVLGDALTAPRVAFAGNAAQALHPVAAQGFNLGLRDAATLAELLAGAADPGAPALLAQYAARRAPDRERVAGFTDQLVRLFSNDVPGLRGARHLGLLALDLLPPAKQAVMRQNLGYGSETPAHARGAGMAPGHDPAGPPRGVTSK